eukprot:PhM_4_TR213/c0_g1_i3/m.43310
MCDQCESKDQKIVAMAELGQQLVLRSKELQSQLDNALAAHDRDVLDYTIHIDQLQTTISGLRSAKHELEVRSEQLESQVNELTSELAEATQEQAARRARSTSLERGAVGASVSSMATFSRNLSPSGSSDALCVAAHHSTNNMKSDEFIPWLNRAGDFTMNNVGVSATVCVVDAETQLYDDELPPLYMEDDNDVDCEFGGTVSNISFADPLSNTANSLSGGLVSARRPNSKSHQQHRGGQENPVVIKPLNFSMLPQNAAVIPTDLSFDTPKRTEATAETATASPPPDGGGTRRGPTTNRMSAQLTSRSDSDGLLYGAFTNIPHLVEMSPTDLHLLSDTYAFNTARMMATPRRGGGGPNMLLSARGAAVSARSRFLSPYYDSPSSTAIPQPRIRQNSNTYGTTKEQQDEHGKSKFEHIPVFPLNDIQYFFNSIVNKKLDTPCDVCACHTMRVAPGEALSETQFLADVVLAEAVSVWKARHDTRVTYEEAWMIDSLSRRIRTLPLWSVSCTSHEGYVSVWESGTLFDRWVRKYAVICGVFLFVFSGKEPGSFCEHVMLLRGASLHLLKEKKGRGRPGVRLVALDKKLLAMLFEHERDRTLWISNLDAAVKQCPHKFSTLFVHYPLLIQSIRRDLEDQQR